MRRNKIKADCFFQCKQKNVRKQKDRPRGFYNIMTIEDLLNEMEPEKRYRIMDRLDKIGYYKNETKA